MNKDLRSLRPWIIGALLWMLLSLVVSLEHLRSAQPDYLFELGGLMSILWLQFSFAGLYHALRRAQGHRAMLFLLVAVVPPLLLYCINLALLL